MSQPLAVRPRAFKHKIARQGHCQATELPGKGPLFASFVERAADASRLTLVSIGAAVHRFVDGIEQVCLVERLGDELIRPGLADRGLG